MSAEQFKGVAQALVKAIGHAGAKKTIPPIRYGVSTLLPDQEGLMLPSPGRVPAAVLRGEIDAMAFAVQRYSVNDHKRFRPQNRRAADAFDRLERARIEALGLHDMQGRDGVRANLDAAFEYRQKGWLRILNPNCEIERFARNTFIDGPQYMALSGNAGIFLDHYRRKKYGRRFELLKYTLHDQAAYARVALQTLYEQGYAIDPRSIGKLPAFQVEMDLGAESKQPFAGALGRVLSKLPRPVVESLLNAAMKTLSGASRAASFLLKPFFDVQLQLMEMRITLPYLEHERDGKTKIMDRKLSSLIESALGKIMGRMPGGSRLFRRPTRAFLPPTRSTAKNRLQRKIEDQASGSTAYKIAVARHDTEKTAEQAVDKDDSDFIRAAGILKHHIHGDRPALQRLTRLLQKSFSAQEPQRFEAAEEGPRLNAQRLAPYLANPGQMPVFMEAVPQPAPSQLAVTMLVNLHLTLPMEETRLRRLRVAHLAAQAFRSTGAAVEILCHTGEKMNFHAEIEYTSNGAHYIEEIPNPKEHEALKSLPRHFAGRYTPVHNIICHKASDPPQAMAGHLARLATLDEIQGNIAGEALLWAHGRLLKQSAPRKLLVVVGAGVPRGNYYRIRKGNREFAGEKTTAMGPFGAHLRAAVSAIHEHSPVRIIHLGVHDNNFGPYYYPQSIPVNTWEKLSDSFPTLFAKAAADAFNPRKQPKRGIAPYRPYNFRRSNGILYIERAIELPNAAATPP